MLPLLLAYLGGLATMVALDLLWLGVVARDFYQSQIGALLLENPNWLAAAVFYLGYMAGVLMFAVRPGLEARSAQRSAGRGALLGIFAYGTYDLTNLATFKGFTAAIAMVDMAWGAVITAAAAWVAHVAASRMAGREQGPI